MNFMKKKNYGSQHSNNYCGRALGIQDTNAQQTLFISQDARGPGYYTGTDKTIQIPTQIGINM